VSSLTLLPCDYNDLEAISKLASAEFGDLAADYSRNQTLWKIDQSSYSKAVNFKGTIVGFYVIFRLSRLGVAAVKRGEFDIRNCPREYFRADNKRKYLNVYIGGVYGTNKISKAMSYGAVNRHLFETKPTIIFARAGSSDGLRILKSFKFNPVSADDDVGGLFFKES
jgi:hypothetical protein